MFPNAKASEQLSILATLDPGNQAVGVATTGWVPLNTHHGLLALVQTGALATGATVDAKLQQAQDASGTGAKDVAGKAIAQLTQASNGANRQVLINLRPEELDVNNGFAFVRLVVTVAAAAANTSAQLLGVNPRLASAETANQAAVAQIV
jgi:hypothetical protein